MNSPANKTIYILDSLRHNNDFILQNIQKWFRDEINRLHYNTIDDTEWNIYTWTVVKENNLPTNLPRQTDENSCIFVVMFAFEWCIFSKLPTCDADWNNSDVKDWKPNLRQYVHHYVPNTVDIFNWRLIHIFTVKNIHLR